MRCCARILALSLIGVFIAPAGMIWHILAITYYALRSVNDASQWKKVEIHASSFFNDLKIALCIGLPWYQIYQRNFGAGNGSRLFYILALLTILAAASPAKGAILFASKQERVPLYKSILLRNDLGIVAQNGGLLPYNIEKDQEDFENKKGALFEIHKQAAQFLLLRINEIQSQLPDNYSLFFSYPPTWLK